MKTDNTFLHLYSFSYVILYVLLSLIFGALIFTWHAPQTIVFYLVFQLLLIGIAYELNEILFTLFSRPLKLLQKEIPSKAPAVAILMTTCDDVYPAAFLSLKQQTYTDYDVFVLDDSEDPTQQALVNESGYQVIRRPEKRGFKAGNLNYWLDHYGTQYKYFVVLDSDSIVGESFVQQMVSYAEHPSNRSIAIFQSKVNNWNDQNLWAQLLGLLAPTRMYILERVNNRLQTVFSFGHNHLVRTQIIRELGGFPESISAEDTAITLLLASQGYTIMLVDVLSHDSEPNSFQAYVRRTTKWAKQTVEVFRISWFDAPLRLKISLCSTLYFYIRPLAFFLLLLMSSLSFVGILSNDHSTLIAYTPITSWRMSHLLFAAILGLWTVQQVLYVSLILKTKVSLRGYFLSSMLSISLAHALAIPILHAMIRTSMGQPVHFVPTNSLTEEVKSIKIVSSNFIPIFLLLGGLYGYGVFQTSYVSLFWAVSITGSLLLLWYAEKASTFSKSYGSKYKSSTRYHKFEK